MVRTPPPPLLPILRSREQGELLALLYMHPETEYSRTELARTLGVGTKRVHDEINRLTTGGLVRNRRRGNMRLVRANLETSLARPLTDLVLAAFGPLPILRETLAAIDGIDHAYIYGSWAARYRGESGHVPHDIDVLIVGHPDRDDIYQATTAASDRLGKDANVTFLDTETWTAREHPFVRELHDKPLIPIGQEAE